MKGRLGFVLFLFVVAVAQDQIQKLTGEQILENVDKVIWGAKDKDVRLKFVLIDKDGTQKERIVENKEKGSSYRLMRFVAPADQKGIAFLSLPNNVMYVYLPEFNKVRRIASHVKNQNFAGTDLSYENLEAKKYSERWNATLVSENDTVYKLELIPKPNVKSDYSKLTVLVRKDNFYPILIEYYDLAGTLFKRMSRYNLKQIDGVWEAMESVMEDVKKQHKTKIIVEQAKYNTGISQDVFTERNLIRQ